MGLIVLSVPNTTPPTVITAYWTVEVKSQIDDCIDRFEQRLRIVQARRDKHATRAKKSQRLKKHNSKSTRTRNMSVDLDVEDFDDLDY